MHGTRGKRLFGSELLQLQSTIPRRRQLAASIRLEEKKQPPPCFLHTGDGSNQCKHSGHLAHTLNLLPTGMYDSTSFCTCQVESTSKRDRIKCWLKAAQQLLGICMAPVLQTFAGKRDLSPECRKQHSFGTCKSQHRGLPRQGQGERQRPGQGLENPLHSGVLRVPRDIRHCKALLEDRFQQCLGPVHVNAGGLVSVTWAAARTGTEIATEIETRFQTTPMGSQSCS